MWRAIGRFAGAGWPMTHLPTLLVESGEARPHRSIVHVQPLNETSQPGPNRLLSGGCNGMFEYHFPLQVLKSLAIAENQKTKKAGRCEVYFGKSNFVLASRRMYFSTFPPCFPIMGLVCNSNRDRRSENSAVVREGLLFPFRTCIRRKRPHQRHAEMFASAVLAK